MFIYKCIIMAMPTRCSTFLNENLQKKNYLAVVLSRQKFIWSNLGSNIFLLVGTDIESVVTE